MNGVEAVSYLRLLALAAFVRDRFINVGDPIQLLSKTAHPLGLPAQWALTAAYSFIIWKVSDPVAGRGSWAASGYCRRMCLCVATTSMGPWISRYFSFRTEFHDSPGRHNLRGYDAVHPYRRTYLRTAAALDLGNGYTPRHCPSLEFMDVPPCGSNVRCCGVRRPWRSPGFSVRPELLECLTPISPDIGIGCRSWLLLYLIADDSPGNGLLPRHSAALVRR